MTLTGRLSLFFVATLALVLAGFSIALYFLARTHLHRQIEDRLEASLNTLVAAVEVAPDGLEWEPAERHVRLGRADLGDHVTWLIADDHGRIIDKSSFAGTADLLEEAAHHLNATGHPAKRIEWRGERWQCSRRRLQADSSAGVPGKNDERKYPALTITAGVPLEPVQATLRQLAVTLVVLSLGIGLVALVAGRSVCRRALSPVSRMAGAARDMDGGDLTRRLPAPASGDELEDLSRAFNSLLDRLQESFERQRRFTGDASHQLRTPLAAILGQTEVALRRERSADEYRRVLATVGDRAGHLRRIVDALLFLARADADTRPPELARVKLREWLPEYLRTWSDHARAADIVCECQGDGPHEIEVQPILLGELIGILIDNACKHSAPGTPVRVRFIRAERLLRLQVEDQGCGIPQADLPHLFTPFFRSAETCRRGIEGVGLGLSIARRLADSFGATLMASSGPGAGACFSLEFREIVRSRTASSLSEVSPGVAW